MNTSSANIDYDDFDDAGPWRRSAATAIDIVTVFIIRAFLIQIISFFWLAKKMTQLAQDFKIYFDSEVIDSQEKLQFIQSHPVFADIIITLISVLVIGSLYHAYLNSSSYHATLGKRLMKVEILNYDYRKISFSKAFLVYYFSLLPIIFATYMMMYTTQMEIKLVQALFANVYNTIFTLSILALSASFSSGLRKQMGFDIVSKIVYLNNRTNVKYPWN